MVERLKGTFAQLNRYPFLHIYFLIKTIYGF